MTDQAPNAAAPAAQADGQGAPAPSPAPAPAPAPTATPAPGASGEKPWYDGHNFKPEDVGFVQNKGWKNPLDVINAYRGLEKFHGVPADQLVKLPKDLNDEKAMGEIYQRLGRPETPQGYDYKPPEQFRDTKLDEGRMKWASEVSHRLGLNKAQHTALINSTLEYEGAIIADAEKKITDTQAAEMDSLKKDWGDAYHEREELGRRAAKSFLPGENKDELLNAIEGAIGSAATMKLFANIGEKLGEDKIHAGASGDRPFGYTPEQAKADIKALMSKLQADKERLKVYNSAKGPDYDEMQRLQKIAYGAAA